MIAIVAAAKWARGFPCLLALLTGANACGAPAPPPPPNLILVSIDTLRADAVGAYGGPTATPALDGLARDGALFEQAIAPASQTAPSHATLFTGQDVLRHGVLENGVELEAGLETLAEVLQRSGYRTGGFAGSFVLDDRFGWSRGFEVYDDEFPKRGESLTQRGGMWARFDFDGFDRSAADTNARALPWLATVPEPFFLFVHYFDPHAPYLAHPELLARVPREFARLAANDRLDGMRRFLPQLDARQLEGLLRAYQSEVLAVDRAVDQLLAALAERGLAERTLVVVTADHGEGLGQHGTLDHAPNVYEEQVRVPMLWRWPGRIAPGLRVREPVGLLSVAPTVAELFGVGFGEAPDGRPFTAALTSGRVSEPVPLIGRRRRYEKPYQGHRGIKYFVRDGRWKLIAASEDPDELYDLAADPHELHDLQNSEPDATARLRAHLDAALARHPEPELDLGQDPEVRRGLEALGYVE